MKRAAISLILSLAAAGCVTAQAATPVPPTISYISAASPAELRACLLSGAVGVKDYMNFPVPPSSVLDMGSTVRIVFIGDPRIYADLVPEGGGTRLTYVRHLLKVRPASAIDDVVARCGPGQLGR